MREDRLVLNFLPVKILGECFKTYVSEYTMKDDYKRLQDENPHCVFHREGSTVYCIPISDGEVVGTEKTLMVKENLKIIGKLVLNKVLDEIVATDRIFTKFFQEFIDTSRDFLKDLPNYQDKLQIMKMYVKTSLNVKIISDKNGEYVLGIVIDARAFYDITENIEEIVRRGINVNETYVNKKIYSKIKGKDSRRNKMVGKIQTVTGNTAKITEYRESDTIATSECYLEASKTNRNLLLEGLFPNNHESIKKEIILIEAKITNGEDKHRHVESIMKEIQSIRDMNLTNELSFSIQNSFVSTMGGQISSKIIPGPTFVFDMEQNKTHKFHNYGVSLYGPFDSDTFSTKEPNIVVLVPNDYKNEIELFISKFENGLEGRYYQQGFVKKYHLSGIKIDYVNVDLLKGFQGYRDACINAIKQRKYDLAIVIIKEEFHKKHGNENPYLVSKAALMSGGIPVQEVEIETIRNEYGLPFVLDNIALACYAKMGGTPWTIRTEISAGHELIIGIGNALTGNVRIGSQERFIGITNVFSADGTYLLQNVSGEIMMVDYKKELIKILKSILDQISKRNGWSPGDNIRLIFHQQFKDFKHEEISAIKDVIDSYSEFKIQFSLVHLDQRHPYQIYDLDQNGISSQGQHGQLVKGKYAAARGLCIKLARRNMLLVTIGPKQILIPTSGIPRPYQIFIHKESTFDDIEYITRQIFQFTFLSWKGFNTVKSPVTIEYSNMIARILGDLRPIKNWNSDSTLTELKDSRWFL